MAGKICSRMNERINRLLAAQVGWMMATLAVLAALSSFSYELYFVLSFTGLLIITEQVLPFRVTPRWQRRIYWVIVFGLVGLFYIVIRRILAILPEGLI